jgi:hypothetical protein
MDHALFSFDVSKDFPHAVHRSPAGPNSPHRMHCVKDILETRPPVPPASAGLPVVWIRTIVKPYDHSSVARRVISMCPLSAIKGTNPTCA